MEDIASVSVRSVSNAAKIDRAHELNPKANIKVTLDGETGELKSAEIIK